MLRHGLLLKLSGYLCHFLLLVSLLRQIYTIKQKKALFVSSLNPSAMLRRRTYYRSGSYGHCHNAVKIIASSMKVL